nr:hypothetical protein [Candidatus Njordarchaeota archaeon]
MAAREFRCDACGITFRNKKEKDAHIKNTHRSISSTKRIPPSQKGGAASEPVAYN